MVYKNSANNFSPHALQTHKEKFEGFNTHHILKLFEICEVFTSQKIKKYKYVCLNALKC